MKLTSAIAVLLGTILRQALRGVWPLDGGRALRLGGAIAFAAGFAWGAHALFSRLVHTLLASGLLPEAVALGLVERLVATLALALGSMLLLSSVTLALSLGFLAADLEALLAAPLPPRALLGARLMQTLASAAAPALLVLVPLAAALAGELPPASWSWLRALVAIGAFLVTPAVAGFAAVLLLLRWFPAGRLQQWTASAAALGLAALVVALRVARPERFFRGGSAEQAVEALAQAALPAASAYPSTWLAAALTGSTPHAVALAGLAAAAAAALLALPARVYVRALQRAREGGTARPPGTRAADRLVRLLCAPLPVRFGALVEKELQLVTRDPQQWTQILLMASLGFLYLYNFRAFPASDPLARHALAIVNMGMAGFVAAAVALRFAYPAVASEGRAFWIVRTAPVAASRLLAAKAVAHALPVVLAAETLTVAGNLLLGAGGVIAATTALHAALAAATLVVAGVGLGAVRPHLAAASPVQAALGLGGISFMAVSLAYVVALTILAAQPLYAALAAWAGAAPPRLSPGLAAAAAVALSLAFGTGAFWWGARSLRGLE